MRQKRAKAYKKQMATYERNFGFRHPYQILYTADFLEAAKGFHLDSVAGVKRTVQGDVKTMITQCCIKELYDAKSDPSIRLAKTMERRRCGHVEKPETPYDCVVECVGGRNKNRYIVATQDVKLREKLRTVPGVPLIYINRSVIILEPPSPATMMIKEEREKAKVGLSPEEAVILGKRKRPVPNVSSLGRASQEVASPEEDSGLGGSDLEGKNAPSEGGKKRKRRGAPGPNPLAVKKAKNVSQASNEQGPEETTKIVLGADIPQPSEGRTRRKRKHKKNAPSSAPDTTDDMPDEVTSE